MPRCKNPKTCTLPGCKSKSRTSQTSDTNNAFDGYNDEYDDRRSTMTDDDRRKRKSEKSRSSSIIAPMGAMTVSAEPYSNYPRPSSYNYGSVLLEVEYSDQCSYQAWYREIKNRLQEEFDNIIFVGSIGRDDAFEVTINKKLVFSKLNLSGFPEVKDVREAVLCAMHGENIPIITNSIERRTTCEIL